MDFHELLRNFGSGLFLALGVLAVFLGGFFVMRWLLLPFAIFGIRNRLDHVLAEMAEMKHQLQRVNHVLNPDGTKARLHEQYVASIGEGRTANCPHCDRQLTSKDLPLGAKHQCPHCKEGIEVLS